VVTGTTWSAGAGREVRVVESAEALAEAAADLVIDAASRRPPTGIMLAGGATPRRSYEVVAARAAPGAFAGVHLWYGDERMVPPDHPDSNHGMVVRAWLGAVTGPGPHVHRIRGELPAAEAAAMADGELRAVGGEAPAIDLALLGIGGDGHTASLFPGDDVLDAGALFAPARAGRRATATLRVLSAARRVVFLVSGAAKAAVVAAAIAGPDRALPASLVAPAGGVLWLLDRAAAARLPAPGDPR
jgi:6-phosphogluconolactonase